MTAASVALARRALRVSLRRPQFLAPLLVFPSILLAVNTGGLSQSTNLPGFWSEYGVSAPYPSFFEFQLAAAMTQSLLLGGVATGIAVALELEMGFFDRLVAAPIPRASIVAGRLLAAGVIAIAQLSWFVALSLIFGSGIANGIPGLLEVYGIGALAGIGFAGIGVTLALRAGNASTVQGVFPLVFVVLFLSSAFFPPNLLTSPADVIATYNPLSYVANGIRAPIIGSTGTTAVLEGFAAALGLALFFGGLATWSLRKRLANR